MAQGGKVDGYGKADGQKDVYWRIFDEFSNQSVDIIIDNGKFEKILEKALSELLHSDMEKEKLPRLFQKNPVIGCKALMRCIRAFLRKGRYPDKDFEKILSIFEGCGCEKLKEIAQEMAGKRKVMADDIAFRLSVVTIKAEPEDNGFHKIDDLNDFCEAQIFKTMNEHTKIEVSRTKKGSHKAENFHALGRCIALSSCTWRCRFTLRSLNVHHVKKFVFGLDANPKGNPVLEYIGFSLNTIGNEGFKVLMDMPQSVQKTISELFLRGIAADKRAFAIGNIERVAGLEQLKRFDFQDNRFKEGDQVPLIRQLCQLANLQEISLSSLSCDECSMLLKSPPPQLNAIRLFELSSAAVETALASCKTLQTVMICESDITKLEVIEQSLKISLPSCNRLKSLKLINCGIDSETACSIIEAAKTCQTLELLDFSNNVIRSTTEMCRLLQGSSFTDLNLYHNSFTESSIGDFLALSPCQQQIPKIHLSMEWKEYAEGKLPNIRHIVFEEMFETNY